MNKISHPKYMRLAAVLLSAAVLISSMDVSMLRVQAAETYDLAEESNAEMPQDNAGDVSDAEVNDDTDTRENEDPADGSESQSEENVSDNDLPTEENDIPGNGDVADNAAPKEETDPEENEDSSESTDTDMPNDIDPDTGAVSDSADEQHSTGSMTESNALAEDGTDSPTPVNTTVSISGISITDKIYDGKPMAYAGVLKATAKIGEGSATKVEDVTASITFSYKITGIVDDGSAFPEVTGTVTGVGGTITGFPKNVGTYKLQVQASGNSSDDKYVYAYTGAAEYSFDITKRPVTVRAKDMQIKITDKFPPDPKPPANEYEYEYLASGFIGTDDFSSDKKPKFTCEVAKDEEKGLNIPGRYAIVPAEGSKQTADAGSNYTVVLQQGTLTVLDKETLTIGGDIISDKVYDGKAVVCEIEKLKINGVDLDKVTIPNISYSYSIFGITDSDEKLIYPSKEGDSDAIDTINDHMPTDAGRYKLKIKATSDGYKGNQQFNFDIKKRPVTIKADDAEIKVNDDLPEFGYHVKGFPDEKGEDTEGTSEDEEITNKFQQKPRFTCNADTKVAGEYTIMPTGAYAGPNYLMVYESGKLTIKEGYPVIIEGIKVSNKIYDGKAIDFTIDPKASVDSKDEPDADKIVFSFTYSIAGTKADGAPPVVDDKDKIVWPTDAGEYALQVTAEGTSAQGRTYKYTKEYPFTITPRPVVVKVKDMELRTGDDFPQYEYEIVEAENSGFLGEDTFEKGPSFICDIESMEEPGTYLITASGAKAGANYDITYQPGTLTVIEREVEKTRAFLRVIAPQPVLNIENGTPLEQMALPDSVTIKTRNIGAADGEVTVNETEEITETTQVIWERKPVDGTSYSVASPTAQTFKLQGTVVLPADVAGPEVPEGAEDPLLVKIQVSVREQWISREKVAKPKANIATGTAVRRGTKVTLSCDTEGADIYYTLDATKPPTKESNRYTYPIEINGYTVIWAFAYKEGYPDSEFVKFSYYTSTNIEGEDSDDSDVLEEDIPSGGIPSGLWSSELKEYTYTGKAIKPEIRVYDHKTRLQEKKDYTITYKNNVNAANRDSQKAPTVTITGKGNYEGRLIKTFTILPVNIESSDVIIDDISVLYNKRAQKPVPTVQWNGKKLKKNKDYTIPEESYTEIGTRTITVTGIGNYTGKSSFEFVITDGVPMSKVKVNKIPDQVYTGKEIKPLPVVKYKGKLLEENKDYTVAYDGTNVKVGTASVFIKGVKGGGFVGTKRVTFKIKAVASLSKAKVSMEFSPAEPVYTGKEITLNRVGVTVNVKGEDGNMHEVRLIQGTDYTISYQNNVKAGKATAVFTGMGAYSGTIKKTFKISPRKLDSIQIKIKMNSSYRYCKGGSKPQPEVTYGSKTLRLGTDYTLSYKENKKLGKNARVIVKGKGNFGGSVDKIFEITPQKMSELKVDAADKVYQNKNNIYKTTVRVLDTDGGRLSAGKDYDKKVKYTYNANTKVEIAGTNKKTTLRKAGELVDEKDIIPVGTMINVSVDAIGNNYTGSVSGTFRIVPASISGAKVTIPVQLYTGQAITLNPSDIQVVIDGTPLPATEYEIVGYNNNINKGTAKVTIHGLHNYGGTKTVAFKIKSKSLAGL